MSTRGSTLRRPGRPSGLQDHAAEQRYQFAGGISISLETDPALADGTLVVDSHSVKGRVTWNPVLEISGQRYPLRRGRTIIGRGSESDLRINDPIRSDPPVLETQPEGFYASTYKAAYPAGT